MLSKSPDTYQAWIFWFDYLSKSIEVADSRIDLLSNGSIDDYDGIYKTFHEQLLNTIDSMLDNRIQRFLKVVQEDLIYGEYENIVTQYKVLKKETKKCMFFMNLKFIDTKFKVSLENELIYGFANLYNEFLYDLKRADHYGANRELEDVIYELKRIKATL